MGYFNQALKSSANYLPSQVTEMLNQERDFAFARLPSSGVINVCAIARSAQACFKYITYEYKYSRSRYEYSDLEYEYLWLKYEYKYKYL